MAILKGIEVKVKVSNFALREWDDPDKQAHSDSMSSKYIKVKAGDPFTINCNVPKHPALQGADAGLSAEVYLDGICVRHPLFRSRKAPIEREIKGARGSENGQIVIRPFRFASVAKSYGVELPQEIIEEYKTKFSDVGCIEIKMYRCSKCRKRPESGVDFQEGGGLSLRDTTVPAKALSDKANCLRSQLDPSQPSPRSYYSSKRIDDGDTPWLRFCFLYRSYEALQSLGLIPRSPSPPPFEEQDIDKMDHSQKTALLKRLQEEARLRSKHSPRPSSQITMKQESMKMEVERLQSTASDSPSTSLTLIGDRYSTASTRQNDHGTSQHKREHSDAGLGFEILGSTTASKRRRMIVNNATDIIEID